MTIAIEKMKETFNEELGYLTDILESGSELSKLAEYLLTTDRNPYSIINVGYNTKCITSFNDILMSLNHALYDDGEVTFYTVNGEPRFGFFNQYEASEDMYLEDIELDMKETYPVLKYVIEVLPQDVNNWIKLSEVFQINDLKRMFLSDAKSGLNDALRVYSKYKLFKQDWIKEL